MAKKITDTENITGVSTGLPPESTEQPAGATETPESGKETPETAVEKKAKTEKAAQEIPEHANRILKSFPGYRELYIDFQGGTYTTDTPPSFRSNATLYVNPYYSKP